MRSLLICAAVVVATAVTIAPAAARRGGCGKFCRQAGAPGAGGGGGGPVVAIRGADRSLRLVHGLVAVTVSCLRKTPCVGAVQICPKYFPLPGGVPPLSYNGVDLNIGAERTASFEIPLLPAAAELVRKRGRLFVFVRVRLSDTSTNDVTRNMTISPGASDVAAPREPGAAGVDRAAQLTPNLGFC